LCVGHIAPEATDGGPIAFLQDGDEIVLDVANSRLDVTLDRAELQRRREAWAPTPRPIPRGVLAKYVKLVRSANVGAICG
jgi:dihydroxy-acid dehydratase